MSMRKEALEKIKKDPAKYQKVLQKWRERGERNRSGAQKEKLERRKTSPYWQATGYQRYKVHSFVLLARYANNRCKKGKLTAHDLWSIAKKQKLICPLTGEKLTTQNISVDHITPLCKGGTNNAFNIQLITRRANAAKNDMTHDELIRFCKNIISRLAPTA